MSFTPSSRVFFVTTNRKNHGGHDGNFAFPFECPHESIADLELALSKAPVAGSKVVYKHLPGGRRLVTGRRDFLLTRDGYQMIEEPRFVFVEEVA